MGFQLRSLYRDGYTCTVYHPTTRTPPGIEGTGYLSDILYNGTEGGLYNHVEDPLQWRNLWDDPGYAAIKADLIADLRDVCRTSAAHACPPRRRPSGHHGILHT